MKKRVRHKTGDVVTIPLPNGELALGRRYSPGLLGVYGAMFHAPPPIEEVAQLSTAFVTGVFSTAIQDGSWNVIGNIPFTSKEETWGPPRYVQDFINPKKFRIYHLGKMRPATADEVRGLERLEMYKPEQLVDRILKELAPSNKTTKRSRNRSTSTQRKK